MLASLSIINYSTYNTVKAMPLKVNYKILRSAVAVNFDSKGRLWRLIPTIDSIYVDYSDDKGKNYSTPIKINPKPQKMSAWPENPPAIAISQSGRIHVLYYADEQQKTTNFYSYSDNKGKSFSPPVLVSDQADTALHYMAKMLLDTDDNLYLFWHDSRHTPPNHQSGKGTLALYYSKNHASKKQPFKNQFISHGICSCCRMATALSSTGLPVIFTRMIFNQGVRDHGLFKINKKGQWSKPQRITKDNWQIEACPEHGPALAIDRKNRNHLAWFSLGETRQGIFYAYSDDEGKTLSNILPLGDKNKLASHPHVMAIDQHVALVWTQFDGNQTSVLLKTSLDRGETWSVDKTIISSTGQMSHPRLLNDGQQFYLSLTSIDQGHQLVEIND
ncbi:MAG: sialidase family protein [Methylococcales bacterium]|nr:sialidase family protein [Methylococcales bacterium]